MKVETEIDNLWAALEEMLVMDDHQFEGIICCKRHNRKGCVECAEDSALGRLLPAIRMPSRIERRRAAAIARAAIAKAKGE